MNTLKYAACSLTLALCCCQNASEDKRPSAVTDIVHYNVVVVPDLSNRLRRSDSLSDMHVIRALTQNIYPQIANHKRRSNQKDRYSILLSSNKLGSIYNVDFLKMAIDLGGFKTQKERIDYLKCNASEHCLQADVDNLTAEFLRIETAARQKPDGADIWSFMNTGVNQHLVVNNGEVQEYNKEMFRDTFRNILVLLTDGYIEAGLSTETGCKGKLCRYLSGDLIKRFRKAYQKQDGKQESIAAFFQRSGYGITPVQNPFLEQFEVLVLEIDDRSLTATGNTTVYPTDYEIIKLFWEDWLRKSGVRRYAIHPLARNPREAEQNLLSFMNIP